MIEEEKSFFLPKTLVVAQYTPESAYPHQFAPALDEFYLLRTLYTFSRGPVVLAEKQIDERR